MNLTSLLRALGFVAVLSTLGVTAGCDGGAENAAEETGDAMEEGAENTEEAFEEAGDNIEDAVD